jgi:hypothetical protein
MIEDAIKILKKTFSGPVFSYPLKSDKNRSYHITLERKLRMFEDRVKQLPTDNDLLKVIKNKLSEIELLNRKLTYSVSNYLWGSQKGSVEHFNLLIESDFVKKKLLKLSETIVCKSNDKDNRLFRIRESDTELSEREDLFHIPFTKRHLVANQRFSIAGLPCLYLGSSIYVCWLEMQKPNFKNVYVAGFKPTNSLKVLNLAYDLESIIRDFSERKLQKEEFLEKFLLWPLIMACSFQTKYSEAPFHEEYIIPGLLLEWITFTNQEIAGLKYLSTKLSSSKKNNYGVNYVLPPQNLGVQYEYCPVLSKEFELTNPLLWDLLTILPPLDSVAYGSGINAENLEDALLNNYENSKFGFVEKQVFSMAFDDVRNSKLPRIYK